MRSPPPGPVRSRQARIARIQARIAALDLVCSGTLLKRTKKCGTPSCRCATDPAARHGPYYEWGYLRGGRLRHRMLSPEQAHLLRQALRNYRLIRRLLRLWEIHTEQIIDAITSRR